MVKHHTSDNHGFDAGLAERSPAWRSGWAWKAGMEGAKNRLVERRLNPMQAIAEGRKLAETLTAKLIKKDKKFSSRDLAVVAVFAQKENLGKRSALVFFEAKDPLADSRDLDIAYKLRKDVPIGFVVCVLGRKTEEFIAHARPLILQDAPLKVLEAIVADAANLKDWRLN
jgi:hypothetical protein